MVQHWRKYPKRWGMSCTGDIQSLTWGPEPLALISELTLLWARGRARWCPEVLLNPNHFVFLIHWITHLGFGFSEEKFEKEQWLYEKLDKVTDPTSETMEQSQHLKENCPSAFIPDNIRCLQQECGHTVLAHSETPFICPSLKKEAKTVKGGIDLFFTDAFSSAIQQLQWALLTCLKARDTCV